MSDIKAMLKNEDGEHRKVRFTHYRSGNLWYETEDGFSFPVPVSDVGEATFMAEDKAILFMRYIRKHIELNNNPDN